MTNIVCKSHFGILTSICSGKHIHQGGGRGGSIVFTMFYQLMDFPGLSSQGLPGAVAHLLLQTAASVHPGSNVGGRGGGRGRKNSLHRTAFHDNYIN